MKIQTSGKPWNKRRFVRNLAAALAMGAFLPVQVSAEEIVDAETNEFTASYLELVDSFVTAERIPTKRLDTPANVTVITAAEIEANHYQDVAEALSHVNGVVIYTAGATTGGQILMNGDGRVLLLIDGHRANNTQGSFASQKSELSMIPSMKNIERIEIVKGGYSALYGSDAVGGVVNIITKKGQFNETTIDLNTGSWNRHKYEITNQGVAGDNLSWFFTGSLSKSRAYEYAGSGKDTLSEHSDYNDNALSLRVDNQFNERNSLTVSATHRTHHYFDNHAYGLYNNFSIDYNFKEDTSTPGWLRYFNNYKSTGIVSSDSARIQGVEYQNGWEIGDRNRLIAGFEWHQSTASDKFNGYDDKKVNNTAFYVQDTMSLGDKWTLVPGIRFDHSSLFGTDSSPKLAANYRADDKTKIYASWGRVYRSPTLAELYTVDENDNSEEHRYYYGNEYVLQHGGENVLEPEKGHTEVIGIEHDFSENMGMTFNFFNSKINDAIFWTGISVPYFSDDDEFLYYANTFIPTNIDTQKRRGMELTFKHKINDNFSYDIGYSHTSLSNKLESESYCQPNGYRVGLRYNNRDWSANLLGIMTSGLDENVYASKNYALLNFNTSYDISDNATVYFRALNLTNQNYSNVSKSYHSPGRFLQTGFQYKF